MSGAGGGGEGAGAGAGASAGSPRAPAPPRAPPRSVCSELCGANAHVAGATTGCVGAKVSVCSIAGPTTRGAAGGRQRKAQPTHSTPTVGGRGGATTILSEGAGPTNRTRPRTRTHPTPTTIGMQCMHRIDAGGESHPVGEADAERMACDNQQLGHVDGDRTASPHVGAELAEPAPRCAPPRAQRGKRRLMGVEHQE